MSDPDWAYCDDPEREHYDYEFNAQYDYRDGHDLTDWCGLQADSYCETCDSYDDCRCQVPVEPVEPIIPIPDEEVPF